MVSDNTGVPEGLPEPPGEVMGPIGPRGEREGCARRWRPPPMRSPNWTRRGGAAPFPSPSPSPFLPPSPILVGLGKGSPTPTGRRTPPPLARASRAGRPPPASFIYGGRGHPKPHKLILEIVP